MFFSLSTLNNEMMDHKRSKKQLCGEKQNNIIVLGKIILIFLIFLHHKFAIRALLYYIKG